MAENWLDMNRRLSELSKLMHHTHGTVFEGYERNDWRPFWAAAKEVQAIFNEGVDVAREERTSLWKAFNDLRDEAHVLQTKEMEDFTLQSDHIRDRILHECASLYFTAFDQFVDYLVDSSYKSAADDVRAKGQRLAAAMKELSENKRWMLSAHKQECFQTFERIRESHDRFWEMYRGKKREAADERASKRAAFVEKVRGNLDKNRDKLAKAEAFLEKQTARVAEIREKREATNSSKWQDIYEGWLVEAEEKVESAREQIKRISGWIEEDENKLT